MADRLRALILLCTALLLAVACGAGGEPSEPVGELASEASGVGTVLIQSCKSDGDCSNSKSGRYCVQGTCCNTACENPCDSCRAGTKAAGNADGTCGPRKAGTKPSPSTHCGVDVGNDCGADGTCDGNGSCSKTAPAGKACGTAKPVCATPANTFTQNQCDGNGSCVISTVSCAPGVCAELEGCSTACATPDQCATKVCSNKVCKPAKALGQPCTDAIQCESLSCVDGVCCDTDCDKTCGSCLGTHTGLNDGFCGPIKHGEDPEDECAEAPPCGTDGKCDGNFECRTVPAKVACGATQCRDGLISGSACNGLGDCDVVKEASCAPYKSCKNPFACQDTCHGSADCVDGYYCEGGKCNALKQKICDADETAMVGVEGVTSCKGFRCRAGECLDTCTDTATDCAAPYVCGENGLCALPREPRSEDVSGCSLTRSAPKQSEAPTAWLLASALLLGLRRRRR